MTALSKCPHCKQKGVTVDRDPWLGEFSSCIYCGYDMLHKFYGINDSSSITPGVHQAGHLPQYISESFNKGNKG